MGEAPGTAAGKWPGAVLGPAWTAPRPGGMVTSERTVGGDDLVNTISGLSGGVPVFVVADCRDRPRVSGESDFFWRIKGKAIDNGYKNH